MKRIIIALCASVSMCMMTSCEPSDVRNGRELYRMYLEKTLIVPEDMKIYNESYEIKGNEIIWKVDVGGTTRGGGKFRETMEFETIGNGLIRVEEGFDKKLFSRGEIMDM